MYLGPICGRGNDPIFCQLNRCGNLIHILSFCATNFCKLLPVNENHCHKSSKKILYDTLECDMLLMTAERKG